MQAIGSGDFSTSKSTMPLTAAEGKWEKLTIKLLARAKEAEEGGGFTGVESQEAASGVEAPAAAPSAAPSASPSPKPTRHKSRSGL